MVNDSTVVQRAVANAGVMLPALLAGRLGIEQLVDARVDLGDRTGGANPGRKVMTMLSAMALGADCIEDCDVLRSGQTTAVLGHRVAAPSTLGTFLRSFTFGHVRQLDRVLADCLGRAWAAGAGPGDRPLIVDVEAGWTYSIGVRQQPHIKAAITAIPEADWLPLTDYPDAGEAQIALAHNLLRRTHLIALPGQTIRATRTLRQRLLTIPGRLTRSGRRMMLRMPARWPWAHDFQTTLTRIRALAPPG